MLKAIGEIMSAIVESVFINSLVIFIYFGVIFIGIVWIGLMVSLSVSNVVNCEMK